MGESLNYFKKEISQLVELIEKKDPQFEKLADQVGIKLASLLQKPQQEMIFMLKRTNMLGKKNKQKQELEKASTMIKQQIELQLKQSNKKSDNDYIDLAELQPNFKLKLTSECKTMLTNFRKVTVNEYVKVHNEYCRMKINEEKAKTKRPKVNDEKLDQQLQSKFEQINFESEMSRIVKELVKNLPPAV